MSLAYCQLVQSLDFARLNQLSGYLVEKVVDHGFVAEVVLDQEEEVLLDDVVDLVSEQLKDVAFDQLLL